MTVFNRDNDFIDLVVVANAIFAVVVGLLFYCWNVSGVENSCNREIRSEDRTLDSSLLHNPRKIF